MVLYYLLVFVTTALLWHFKILALDVPDRFFLLFHGFDDSDVILSEDVQE